MLRLRTLTVGLGAVLVAACVDKAKADYDRCVERQKAYDVAGAYSACAAAVADDPKSVSGLAAAKDLDNMTPVYQKLQNERAERESRDKAITKDEPLPPPRPSATASAAVVVWDGGVGGPFFDQANALFASGDLVGARAILEPRVRTQTGASDEVALLRTICKSQKDKACLTALGRKYH
jgi:hypothetical protein